VRGNDGRQLDALLAKPPPGRPRKLSGKQIARSHALIVGRDPRQLSFAFALWTREMVRLVSVASSMWRWAW
jgi:hypothetical protein